MDKEYEYCDWCNGTGIRFFNRCDLIFMCGSGSLKCPWCNGRGKIKKTHLKKVDYENPKRLKVIYK